MSNEERDSTTFTKPPHLFIRSGEEGPDWFYTNEAKAIVRLHTHDLTVDFGRVEEIEDFELVISNDTDETITLEVSGNEPATVTSPARGEIPPKATALWQCKTGGGVPVDSLNKEAQWTIVPVGIPDPTFRVRWQAKVGPERSAP